MDRTLLTVLRATGDKRRLWGNANEIADAIALRSRSSTIARTRIRPSVSFGARALVY